MKILLTIVNTIIPHKRSIFMTIFPRRVIKEKDQELPLFELNLIFCQDLKTLHMSGLNRIGRSDHSHQNLWQKCPRRSEIFKAHYEAEKIEARASIGALF